MPPATPCSISDDPPISEERSDRGGSVPGLAAREVCEPFIDLVLGEADLLGAGLVYAHFAQYLAELMTSQRFRTNLPCAVRQRAVGCHHRGPGGVARGGKDVENEPVGVAAAPGEDDMKIAEVDIPAGEHRIGLAVEDHRQCRCALPAELGKLANEPDAGVRVLEILLAGLADEVVAVNQVRHPMNSGWSSPRHGSRTAPSCSHPAHAYC